jgi:putative OPT family oligopeptide transporter
MLIPMFFIFNYFAHDFVAALVATVTMAVAGFFFAAVAGFLVGLIGSSSNPISGLTLTTLLITALLMVMLGKRGESGVLAVLAVATVVCCACGLGGDMMQDLKVGHILGGTPWRMQIGELIGVVAAAFVLVIPVNMLHQTTVGGIGGEVLPAPQAGLMALMADGIVAGNMTWPLVITGMLFGLALIMLNTPSPMIIAVGMYLPFPTTFAIFVGGMFAWWLQRRITNRAKSEEDGQKASNTGILLASGLVAGEALMGVILAAILIISGGEPRIIEGNPYLGLIVFPIVGYILIALPIRRMLQSSSPADVV